MRWLAQALLGVSLCACFVAPIEEPTDAGSEVHPDAGDADAGDIDGGVVRECRQEPDSGLYLYVGFLPAGCTSFSGNLLAGGLGDSKPTNAVSLQQIEGRFLIENAMSSDLLRQFRELRGVSEDLWITDSFVTSAAGMDRLRSVGALTLTLNPQLADVEFPVLEEIRGDLTIWNMTELRSLEGLRSLKSVGGKLSLSGNRNLSSAAVNAFIQRVHVDGGVVRQ